MTQHFPLNYEDPVHQGFFDAIQELLGASVPNLRIVVSGPTQLSIVATSGNGQNSVAIQGLYRWVTSTVTAALPGGLSSGVGNVWVTGSANDFGGAAAAPDAATVYTFGLEIRASGTPSTAVSRKVGEVDVVSSAIVAYRQIVGSRPTGDMTLSATPDTATQPGLLIRGASGQSANLIQVKNNAGSTIWSVSPTGEITTSDVNLTGTLNVTGASSNQVLVASGTEFAPALITNSSVQTGTLALTKLASGTSAQMIVGNESGVPTYRTISGDIVVSDAGVTSFNGSPIVNGDINASAAIAESKLSLASDAAAATASRRTLGTGELQACAGNDSRLSNSRAPNGTAGGALSGTYPNPTLAASTTSNATNESAITGTVTARKYADGQTILNGTLSTSGGNMSGLVATLPTGYRPAAQGSYICYGVSSTSGHRTSMATVATNGQVTVTPVSGDIVTIHLSSITFHAG